MQKMASPQARREAVAFTYERGLPERRACGLVGLSRSCLRYVLRLPAKDALVVEAMQRLSAQYPRYDYRRIRIFLQRAGHVLGVHRTHRLWRQARFGVRHGGREHRADLHRGRALRRGQAIGLRPRGQQVRDRGVSDGQIRLRRRAVAAAGAR